MEENEDFRFGENGEPYKVFIPTTCPECGSSDIVRDRDERVYIRNGQMIAFPWCRNCGLVIDFMIGVSGSKRVYIEDGR